MNTIDNEDLDNPKSIWDNKDDSHPNPKKYYMFFEDLKKQTNGKF